ncbi:MAG TPA: ABC transporter substrate-binding protein [Trebonia sp.]|jgi:ABC-type branched-subunit amino acid transport system substrate-binding protein|nr:ABC transporter substrate-binding protein [Trebonia sp.]
MTYRNMLRLPVIPALITVTAVLAATACSSSSSGSSSPSSAPAASTGAASTAGAASASPAAAAGGAYTVGAVTSLTGPLAFIGTALADGAKDYFNYVDAHGGVNGHKVNFITTDDGGAVTQAVTDVHQLVQQDQVSAITGWILTNIESAVEPYALRESVPLVTQGCDPTIATAANKVVYCVGLPETLEDKPLVDFAATKAGSATPKVAVLDMDSEAQIALQGEIVADAKAKNWPVVLKQIVALTATDMTTQANAVVQSGATMVICSLDSEREQLFDQALRSAGSKIPVINFDAGEAFSTLQKLADPNLYVYSPFAYPTDSAPGVAIYDAQTKAANQQAGTPFLVNGWVEAQAVAAGLAKCGYPCPGSKLTTVMSGLGQINTEGMTTGPFKYSSSFYLGLSGGEFYTWDPAGSKLAPVSGFMPIAAAS